ncbi:MAG: DUF262 domain-containing HNH endonuclease family protein [Candidatus Kapaibacterium sp.]
MIGIQDTSSVTYRQLMGNGVRYEIPKFQRDYTWEIEQWDDLWYDINVLRKNEESDHYMGYLVLQTSENKNFQIIDGQQRLTTLSVLILVVLKCLKDLADSGIDTDNNLKRIEALRSSYIGFLDPVTLISNNKLKLNRNSDDYYRQHLVLLKELPLRNINSPEKQLRDCFNWYYDRIKIEFTTGEALAAFIDNLSDKLFFTRIIVSDDFNAFKVFETLNARGVQLSASDLLKNYLFSVVDATKPHSSEIEELELLWSNIVGKLGNQKFEDYLRYYWNSKNKTVRKTALFKTIRKYITDKAQAFALLRELDDGADVYMALQNPDDDLWNGKPELSNALRELKLFQIKQTLSLFIAAYYNLDQAGFTRVVKSCSVISFRYNVIGGLNPNEQEDVYNSVALKINQTKQFILDDIKSIYVSNDNFETSFSSKSFKPTSRNHKIVKYILSKVEKYKYRNDIPDSSDLFTIEHILPQSADENWGEFDSYAINRCVYRLGNLTLLEKKLNKDVDVLEYTDKKSIFSKSNCMLTSTIPDEFNEWNEANVSARQKEFAKDAKAIWQIQF